MAVGGRNSADIAQEVHETVLRIAGAVDVATLLRYGVALPSGGLLVGIYLDDLGVVAIVPKDELRASDGPDRDVILPGRRGLEAVLAHRGVCGSRVITLSLLSST